MTTLLTTPGRYWEKLAIRRAVSFALIDTGSADGDADGDGDTDADSDTDGDSVGDGDADTDADTDVDADVDSDADSDSDMDSDTDSDSATDTRIEGGVDSGPDLDSGTHVDGGPGQKTVIGNPCQTDEECGPNHYCVTVFSGDLVPDGYCLERTSCYGDDANCPEGTLCAPLPHSSVPGFCLVACVSDDDCRPGYDCAKRATLPEDTEGSPTSSGKACWTIYPVCTVGMDQTCNDESFVSSIMGTCNEDGTCTCNEGTILNPRTGRCRGQP
jgi:hypothetical protein